MTAETNKKTQEIHKAIDQLAGSLHHFTNLLFGASVEKADPVNKKKKVEKDPNAPKRNLSSYMLYSQAVRPKLAAEHPDLKAIEIAKLVGVMWNKLSEKEKALYIKQAEKEKIRFEKENASYKTTLASEEKQQSDKRKERSAEEVTSEKKAKKSKKEKHAHRSEKSGDKKSKKKNF
ncbi:hypothetical protein G6F66_009885 [Rhizopus arrhizus]|nr:hypothetical protein G6F66_009885 [Rhizopus arrhizus]